MTALLGGLAAAFGWASSTLLAARSSRGIGLIPTLTWVVMAGFLVSAPMVAFTVNDGTLTRTAAGWLGLAGSGNLLGLAFMYAALARGHVAIVSSITSSEGALAALGAIALGERPGPLTLIGMLVVVAGVVTVAAAAPVPDATAPPRPLAPTLALALAGAACFAVNLVASGEVSSLVPLAWVTLPARLIGVMVIAAAIAGGRHVFPPGRRAAWAAAAGLAEVAGLVAFALGARDSVAVASVMASQFAVFATVGGYLFFRERLTRTQMLAIAVTAAGVAVVASQAG